MKISIISINMYSKYLNFACPLHTYAFQQFLLQNGIECTVLNYKPNYYEGFDLRHPYSYYKKKYDARLKKIEAISDPEELTKFKQKLNYVKEKMDLWEPIQNEREKRYYKFQNFIDKYYIKTEKCYDSDLLEVEDPGFDCYICVTDVIWKNTPDFGYDRGFFLGSTCMENKRKIAYSASRGINFANTEAEVEQFFYYLKDFDYISVREKTLQLYIEQNSNLKASLVLDPVFFHDQSFYEKISIKPEEEHYVLLYYVMEEARETIRQAAIYAKAHNQKIIEITDLPVGEGRLASYPDIDYTLRYAIGIEEWLGYLMHADCIFTNSFHACCFSILFEKQFFAGHRDSEKVALILDCFGLSHRKLVSNGNPVEVPPAPVDYTKIRPLLKQKQKESANFILNAIHHVETTQRQPKDYSGRKKQLTYRIQYNSGKFASKIVSHWDETNGILKYFSSGSQEFIPNCTDKINDGHSRLDKNRFIFPHYHFGGWKIRIKIDNRWFWLMADGTLMLKTDINGKLKNIRIFQDESEIPYIPVNNITCVVAEALWQPRLPLKYLRILKRKLSKIHKFL